MIVSAKQVQVLGSPVGNLWDVFVDGVFYVRVTYHGNSLVRLKTKPKGVVTRLPSTEAMEVAIDKLYRQ